MFHKPTRHASLDFVHRVWLEFTGKRVGVLFAVPDEYITVDVTVMDSMLVTWMISGETTITVTVSVGRTIVVGGVILDEAIQEARVVLILIPEGNIAEEPDEMVMMS